jgi:hypothetical protein
VVETGRGGALTGFRVGWSRSGEGGAGRWVVGWARPGGGGVGPDPARVVRVQTRRGSRPGEGGAGRWDG